jgi:hypothetical protein
MRTDNETVMTAYMCMGVRSGLAQLGEHRDTSYLCDHCIPQKYLGLPMPLLLVKWKTKKLYCIKVKKVFLLLRMKRGGATNAVVWKGLF